MDIYILTLLLLGAAPDGSSMAAPGSQSRAHAVASARIVRGEVISFGPPASRRPGDAAKDDQTVFRIATIGSLGVIADSDGSTVQVQEFH